MLRHSCSASLLVAVLGCCAALAAGETTPDPAVQERNQAKATWIEAAKANDVWSCLQLEEWGREQKSPLRLGPVLGTSVVHGSILFAVPETMQKSADFGDRIIMTTDRRAWVVAPDGRPLQPAVTLSGWAQAISWDGNVIASGRKDGWRKLIEVGSVRMSDGKPIMRGSISVVDAQSVDGIGAVADDGSAIAVTVFSDNQAVAPQRQIAIVRSGEPIHLPGVWAAMGVGRGGAWLAADSYRGEMLIRNPTERTRISRTCIGPGIMACTIQDKPLLILPDGKDVPLVVGREVGKNPHMVTTGGWLALVTGDDAKGVSSGGLTGDDEGKVIDLPTSVMLWRWADLAADPNSAPSFSFVGAASLATDRAQTLWFWNGNNIEELDLSGTQPTKRPYFQAPDKIAWAWSSGNCLIVKIGSSRHLVYAPDKTLLWDGTCDSISIKRPDLALTRRYKGDAVSYQLQYLSADPAARKEIALALPAVDMPVEVEYRRHDYVVAGPSSLWRRFDLNGKVIDEGTEPRPPVHEWELPYGRFFRDTARIFPKAKPYPTDLDDRLLARDAWRFGPISVLMDRDHVVYALTKNASSSKKRSTWTELGQVPHSDHFAMAGTTPVVAGNDGIVWASLIPGPALNRKVPANTPSTDFASGPWRITDMLYIPRGSREYVWDEPRIGFAPSRLRGPDEGSMLAITRSVMIEMDIEAAKLVGRSP